MRGYRSREQHELRRLTGALPKAFVGRASLLASPDLLEFPGEFGLAGTLALP